VTVQDVTSGTVLATTTVGWIPTALMLDGRARRLFVLNEAANGVGGDTAGSVSVLDVTRL
jgi:DNA-binding beta-propeller fold protein YncE